MHRASSGLVCIFAATVIALMSACGGRDLKKDCAPLIIPAMEKLGRIQIGNVLFYAEMLEAFDSGKYPKDPELIKHLRREIFLGLILISEFFSVESSGKITGLDSRKLCSILGKWDYYNLDLEGVSPEIGKAARLSLINAVGGCDKK